jgi:hypothetical protein
MKSRFGKIIQIVVIPFILNLATANQAACQTTMGILPVNVAPVGSSVLTLQQWQSLSVQLQDYITRQLAGLGPVSKLSREHILLLTKDVPAANPESLDAESYVIISKKEKLQYLLQCSIESIRVNGKNVLAPLRIIIMDGKTGKVFWEDAVNQYRVVSAAEITGQILLEDVFQPSVNEISKEIIKLNY